MENTDDKEKKEESDENKKSDEAKTDENKKSEEAKTDENKKSEEAKTGEVKETPSEENQNSSVPEPTNPFLEKFAIPTALQNNLISLTNRFNVQDMEIAELRVKVLCLEKNNAALKMELKCAELQLEAKTKIDVQKTRLVELLDGKVTSMTRKNGQLVEMVEELLKDKNSRSSRLVESTKKMEELANRLVESERARVDLRTMNQELKTMLEQIENKGSQIAQLAKQKILKYKEETVKIQQELDEIKKNGATPEDAGAAAGAAAAGEQSDRFQQHWKKVDDLLLQLDNVFQGDSTKCPRESVMDISKEIKQEVEQLRTELNAFVDASQGETDKLRSLLGNIRQLVVNLQRLGEQYSTQVKTSESEELAAKDQEITQLREGLSQLNSSISKLISFTGTQ